MDHHSSTPRTGHPLDSLGTEPEPSERVRRRASELRAAPYAVRFHRRRDFASLEATLRRSGGTLPATRSTALSALLWLTNSDGSGACCRTPSAPSLWGGLPRLCILSTAHPHIV